jgi:hypothetical protein
LGGTVKEILSTLYEITKNWDQRHEDLAQEIKNKIDYLYVPDTTERGKNELTEKCTYV